MAKPGNSFKINTLREDFPTCLKLVESGRSIEVLNGKAVLGIIKPNSGNLSSEHTYTEKDAINNFRELFALTSKGKTIVVTRFNKPSFLITHAENHEPK